MDYATTRTNYATHFGEEAVQVRDIAPGKPHRRRVEFVVAEREAEGIRPLELDVLGPGLRRLHLSQPEHALAEVRGDHLAGRPHSRSEGQREVAGTGRNVECAVTW